VKVQKAFQLLVDSQRHQKATAAAVNAELKFDQTFIGLSETESVCTVIVGHLAGDVIVVIIVIHLKSR
jgi:hypothetical protein